MNQITHPSDLESKDILAIVLSFIWPGIGHCFVGQIAKGIVMHACFFVIAFVTCGIGIVLIVPAVVLDAYCVVRARKLRPVGDWEFYPDHKQHIGI